VRERAAPNEDYWRRGSGEANEHGCSWEILGGDFYGFFCQKKEEIVYGFRVKKNEFGKKKCGNLNYQTSTYVRYTMYMPPHLFVATYTEIKICPPKN
jgi:hypothetical protein